MKRLHRLSESDIVEKTSRNDVELALKALEIEDEREKEAIRSFYARERKPYQVTWRTVVGIGIVFAVVLGILLISLSKYLSSVNW